MVSRAQVGTFRFTVVWLKRCGDEVSETVKIVCWPTMFAECFCVVGARPRFRLRFVLV